MPTRPLFISPRFSGQSAEDFDALPMRGGWRGDPKHEPVDAIPPSRYSSIPARTGGPNAGGQFVTVPEGYRPGVQVRSLILLSDGVSFLGSLRLNAKTKALEAIPAVNRAAAVRYPSAESASKVIERNATVLSGATAVPVA